MSVKEKSLSGYLEVLASSSHVPVGGAAAAVTGSITGDGLQPNCRESKVCQR